MWFAGKFKQRRQLCTNKVCSNGELDIFYFILKVVACLVIYSITVYPSHIGYNAGQPWRSALGAWR